MQIGHRTNKREHGATMVEYALLVALIAVMGVASVKALRADVEQPFNIAGHALNACAGGTSGAGEGSNCSGNNPDVP
jgi:Flp pilus assembly pilin Flp